jgi:uncharacterized membrane protein YedE/YeeE
MQVTDVDAVARHVLWAAFALAAAFGAIAQRTHFCTMGAVADIVSMGDWTRMRQWALAIGVSIIGFNAMVALGWINAGDSLYASSRLTWLSSLVGGLLFGFGMVLASGCGSKTLVRIGAGSLKSLVVFIVLAIAAFATLKGLTAVVRVDTVDTVFVTLPPGQDLPSLVASATGAARPTAALVLGSALGGAVVAWALASAAGRSTDNLLAGFGIGAVIVGVWWASGRLGFVEEDPNTLEAAFVATYSRRMESLSFVAPFAHALEWLIYFSDAGRRLTLGVVSALGVVAGSAAVALATRTFHWEGFRNAEDTANHIVGGILMGVGGITALGCTIGQGLSGVSTLSVGSFIALGAIITGAVLALRYQMWRLERLA